MCNRGQLTKLTTLSVQRANLCLLDNKPLREDGTNSGRGFENYRNSVLNRLQRMRSW